MKRFVKTLIEIDYKKIAVIGFWRQGADLYTIAYAVDLPIEEVEQIIDNYCQRKNIKQ